jgi:hypothetical protein
MFFEDCIGLGSVLAVEAETQPSQRLIRREARPEKWYFYNSVRYANWTPSWAEVLERQANRVDKCDVRSWLWPSSLVGKKLYASGGFSPFPGTTVICPVTGLHEVMQRLTGHRAVMKNFTVVPESSLHMTLADLFTSSNRTFEQWRNVDDRRLSQYQGIYNHLQEQSIEPSVTMSHISTRSGILLELSVENYDECMALRTALRDIAGLNTPPYTFHVTLAYRNKDSYTKECAAQLRKFTKTLSSLLRGMKLQVGKPRLTYFNDMTVFLDWDGSGSLWHF